jgi:elongation factor Ts
MHVAAASPKFLKADEIDEDYKQREAAIYKAQLLEEGKPENMIDKIIMGKLGKLAKEVCLLEQAFVKDPDMNIKKLIASVGSDIEVVAFHKLNLGEGIEKKEDNLADEVAKMTGKQ